MTATKTAPVSTDRIEKRVVLKAPRARVWRALTDSREFGEWFQASLNAAFTPGARVMAHVSKSACGHDNIKFEMVVERIEAERYFSFRWHPFCVEPGVDYSLEPMTLVEFRLSDASDGTLLEIVESGFDALPASRRAEAFRANDGGWNGQIGNLDRYVTGQ